MSDRWSIRIFGFQHALPNPAAPIVGAHTLVVFMNELKGFRHRQAVRLLELTIARLRNESQRPARSRNRREDDS